MGDTWLVNYVLSDVTAAGGGFTASAGTGTLTDPLSNVTILSGEAKGGSGPAFEFFPDGHRIPGDAITTVGRGWLLPPSSTDDWLVRAVVVPEPTTTALLAAGLVGLGFAGRRRRSRP